jgi:hypothetical protein
MTVCRSFTLMATFALSAILALPGPSASRAADAATSAALDPEVLRLREAAWRAYFAGDERALRDMLPPDFIGINMDDGPFVTREKALEQARSFRASGGRLVTLMKLRPAANAITRPSSPAVDVARTGSGYPRRGINSATAPTSNATTNTIPLIR